MAKRKNSTRVYQKKDNRQLSSYNGFIKNSKISPDDTIATTNSHLVGSNQLNNNDKIDIYEEKPVPPPWRIRFIKWMRNNASNPIGILIITTILGFGAWTTNQIFELNTEISITKVQIENLRQTVQELKIDNVTKEILSLQIDSLEADLKNDVTLVRNELNNRLNIIEKQIDKIENK